MKSIVEEASSINKAIDSAWQRAGQPEEFSVRIFEHPQRNFFGFTIRSAKIGLFFQESRKQERRSESRKKERSVSKSDTQSRAKKQPAAQAKPKTAPSSAKKDGDLWTEAMIGYAKEWLSGLFDVLDIKNASFEINPQKYHLKVVFKKPVLKSEDHTRIFYRSCAHLLLQALRNTCKRPLKGYKIVLTHS